MLIPDGLRALGRSPEGAAWLASLPTLADTAVRRWSLTPGEPYAYANASLAVPVTRADGTAAVLKLPFPHRESVHEGEALRRWDGAGAVRLLDHDASDGALLLERCAPGTPLSECAPAEALAVLVALLPRLWVPAGEPFTPLAEEAAWWSGYLVRRWEAAGRAFPRALLDLALDALGRLPRSMGDPVLVNQDLHCGNVLRAEREPWLVIDPKPLAGERELGVAPVLRDPVLGHSRAAVVHRLDRLCSELSLDRERARLWALAQALAWAFDGDRVLAGHLDVAQWLADAA